MRAIGSEGKAGVDPACMLSVRCRSEDVREGGRAGSGATDWRLDAREGERRTCGTVLATMDPLSEYAPAERLGVIGRAEGGRSFPKGGGY